MSSKRAARVWIDGCFDLVHFGHANVVRQAKELGDYLIVGIHSDEEISKHKGPPVFSQEERCTLLKAVKWVDEVVTDAPYMTQLSCLEDHNCDFCVHGDDITVMADGVDAYSIVKMAGKYVEVKRTEGISTTDLVYRMLKAIHAAKVRDASVSSIISNPMSGDLSEQSNHRILNSTEVVESAKNIDQFSVPYCIHSASSSSNYTSGNIHYMPNALRISNFLMPARPGSSVEEIRAPFPGEIVVYAPGVFDLFHVGHVEFLKKCHEIGTYLIIGLYSNEAALFEPGRIGPILNAQERLLSLFACRYVNNVILDVPYIVTESMLDFFKIDYVVVGTDTNDGRWTNLDPMAIPKARGIYRRIDSGSHVTTRQVIHRIIENVDAYEKRNKAKEQKESVYNLTA